MAAMQTMTRRSLDPLAAELPVTDWPDSRGRREPDGAQIVAPNDLELHSQGGAGARLNQRGQSQDEPGSPVVQPGASGRTGGDPGALAVAQQQIVERGHQLPNQVTKVEAARGNQKQEEEDPQCRHRPTSPLSVKRCGKHDDRDQAGWNEDGRRDKEVVIEPRLGRRPRS